MKKSNKKTRLEVLSERSHTAIDLVVRTIETLKDTNNAINEEQKKNDEAIATIQATNHSLSELKTSNEKIIGNFEKLLQ